LNNYQSAELGLYSQANDQMHEVLFGGLSLTYYDHQSGTFFRMTTFRSSTISRRSNIDSSGHHTQDYIGDFPTILDQGGNRLRFGTDAEFSRCRHPMSTTGDQPSTPLSGPTC